MKFLRFGAVGEEKPGCLGSDGAIRDISALVTDIDPQAVASGSLIGISQDAVDDAPIVTGEPRIGACMARTGNFIAVGLNYVQHAIETNAPIPDEPILFNKASSCISGPNDDVVQPKGSTKLDWEVELAFVIGKRASYVGEEEALGYIFGYMICNDVSERAFQIERGGQWMKGKCCPTFGPIGPWLVTADEIGDPQNLKLWLEVNGDRVQDSNTDDMIFPIAKLVSYISQFMVLEPGDIVTTGTPPGVGLGMTPNRFLKPGDTMRLGIEGLGEQRQQVSAI
ncbi:fumarylacetoacetate hydrolase family protein [Hwanghaeella sp.]|uniref:fumarylacetoacetate hydrolase family protein n=1 Tax=Hwanghaeella sp. TaxID=2605943 RepID=UPI003CCBF18E